LVVCDETVLHCVVEVDGMKKKMYQIGVRRYFKMTLTLEIIDSQHTLRRFSMSNNITKKVCFVVGVQHRLSLVISIDFMRKYQKVPF
jgi:hypothetical protein